MSGGKIKTRADEAVCGNLHRDVSHSCKKAKKNPKTKAVASRSVPSAGGPLLQPVRASPVEQVYELTSSIKDFGSHHTAAPLFLF